MNVNGDRNQPTIYGETLTRLRSLHTLASPRSVGRGKDTTFILV
ncbi:hypothetical protein [Nostoc sp.]